VLTAGDVLVFFAPGGGGFGDPLDREPERVARDVANSWVSHEQARDMYGVTFGDDGGLDEAATAALRERMRGGRRQRQTADWIGEDWCKPNPTANDAQRIGENISLDAQGVLHCCRCGTALSGSQGCVALTQRPLKAAGPWMALRYRGDGPNFVLEEISCPSCATLLSVREVRRDGGTKTSGGKA
jgi:N-methylhydantoinase B